MQSLSTRHNIDWVKVDDYLRKKLVNRSWNFDGGFLTWKERRFRENNNLVIVEKISRFIRGLTAEHMIS